MKGMLFGCEQPFLWGERCVTSQKTAAKETNAYSSAFSLDIIISTSSKRTKSLVLLMLVLVVVVVLCTSLLPCAYACACVVGVLSTGVLMLSL